MKLYHQVERVFNELGALGIGPNDAIEVEQLVSFDQYHYLGTEAVDEAIRHLNIMDEMRVLEVGGGIGGPARHLAHTTRCRMTVMELQPDLNDTAIELTKRCGLSNKIDHVCGDILKGPPGKAQFEALVSWLTFLHIPQREALYAQCYKALAPGAGMYAEDYFARGALTDSEREKLAQHVYCERVPSMDDYRRELAGAGFEKIKLTDMSDHWTAFVIDRLRKFETTRERNLRLHGADIVEGLLEFYATVVELFEAGHLGGVRLVAWKPA